MGGIENVSDTAAWVAIYRAIESERPDALFRDPFARELGGARGEAIVQEMKRGMREGWAIVTRTYVIDEFLRQLLTESGVQVVINLAAGLDSRPYRMELSPSLLWIEGDLPELNAYKAAKMELKVPRCELKRWDVDLSQAWARNEFFEKAAALAKGRKTVVLTEGLLMYLTEAQVIDLTKAINDAPYIQYWIQDFLSPRTKDRVMKQWRESLKRAPFLFAPAKGASYFKEFGWGIAQVRSLLLESVRIKRPMPLGWLWKFIYELVPPKGQSEMLNAAGVALLRRER